AAELFAEKERAQVTLASIADGVITTDTDGWVEYLNPVAEALTGWTTASARGLPLRGIVNTVDETTRKITPNPIEMVLREERTIEVSATMLLVRNDGSEIPIVQSAAPIRARTGKIIGVVLVMHDVSRGRYARAPGRHRARRAPRELPAASRAANRQPVATDRQRLPFHVGDPFLQHRRQHRARERERRAVHAGRRDERRRRGLLHGEGKGPQPRAVVSRRRQRAVGAPGR